MTDNRTPKQLKKSDNILKAYSLYSQGYSYDAIGMSLGCAKSTAWGWVNEAQQQIIETQTHDLNVLRNDELERLNNLIAMGFADLKQAIDVADDNGRLYRDGVKSRSLIRQELLKYIQERSRLLGLYAPAVQEQLLKVSDLRDKDKLELVDYDNLSLDELQSLFADKMREF